MKYAKFRICEWRDAPFTRSQAVAAEIARIDAEAVALSAEAARLQRIEKVASSQSRVDRLTQIADRLERLAGELVAVRDAEAAAAQAAAQAAKTHPSVGTFGYQVIDDAGAEVLRELDEAGNHFPPGATYCSEIVEPNAPAPAWAGKAPEDP